LREKLNDHLSRCPKRKILCPVMKCNTVVIYDQLENHIEENLKLHINLLDEGNYRSVDQRVQELMLLNGVLLWKIADIERRIKDAVSGKTLSIDSKPFYSSKNGYKMCARLYLNGDGIATGTHISLYLIVMKGEHDSVLPWPFQQQFSLVLIDQQGKQHITNTFLPSPSSSSFLRPKTDMNTASGSPSFVPLSTFHSGGYLRDDCLFINVIVDTSRTPNP
jgi:hypothetical protein